MSQQGPPQYERPKRPCAICDSTNATTWICRPCRSDPANRHWSTTPRRERSAKQFDEGYHRSVGFDIQRKPEPYSNDLCIEIVRLWLLKQSQTEIAHQVGCSQPYVFKVVAYWRRVRLNTLSALMP